MHPLKNRKQSPEHIAKRIAAIDFSKRKAGAGRPANTPEVLWSKVDKRGPDECWPWKGFTNHDGYGRTWINDRGYYAHRVIFNLVNPGVISLRAPDHTSKSGFLIHSCDNPVCCNPAHLRAATHQENMDDRSARGRVPQYKGDTGPRCKLTMEQAREIRSLRKQGISARELSARYAIHLSSIKSILRGDSYRED